MATSNPLGGNSSHGTASHVTASHGMPPGVAESEDDQPGLEARHDATGHDAISPRQVAPIPHVEIEHEHLDVMELVREAIHDHPGAEADEIVRLLAEKQIQVSPTLVLQQLVGSGAAQTVSSFARPPAAERS